MRYVGTPYTISLNATPTKIKLRGGLSSGVLVQPQDVDLCYRLDGVEEALNGFVLPALTTNHFTVNDANLVVWAARNTGRLVIQEFAN